MTPPAPASLPTSTASALSAAPTGSAPRAHSGWLLPLVVLLLGWTLSAWLFILLERDSRLRQEEFFGERIAEAQAAIRVRMNVYIDALRGGTSFYSASRSVDRDEWRVFAESLQLRDRYPGINGLGLILSVPADQADEWKQRVRAAGEP